MRFAAKFILFGLLLSGLIYLALPPPGFPDFPPDVLLSSEPADTESPYRRAFYSNYSRNQIMDYYARAFRANLIQIRLNHPPEESFAYIRDQTRSSWLEQLVHPGRESLYVNGFYPTKPTEQIIIDNIHYQNRITLHYFPSTLIGRLTVLLLGLIGSYWLYREYAQV